MRVDERGRSAVSHCKTLDYDRELSVVQIGLETGRTHQIRVHMQFNKTPVLGDATYGSVSANQKYGAKRQMLHAHRLRFTHPVSQQILDVQAEIPDDFTPFMVKVARRGSGC